MTAGQAGPGSKTPPKRGVISGWTAGAVRRHTRWLYSIDADALELSPAAPASRISPDGAISTGPALGEKDLLVGVAVTLTLRECPASHEDWERHRRAWQMKVERLGAIRTHWVVEWQARGVPHLHTAIYFPAGTDPVEAGESVITAWLDRAGKVGGAAPQAQFWNRIDGPLGWLQYLSKHAARGVGHYQRQGKPAGWIKTGRLWGYRGDWPVVEPLKQELSWPQYWALRRLVRSWRIADARAQLLSAETPKEARQARRRITYARRMLRSADPHLSRVRGVSEWIPVETLDAFLDVVIE